MSLLLDFLFDPSKLEILFEKNMIAKKFSYLCHTNLKQITIRIIPL